MTAQTPGPLGSGRDDPGLPLPEASQRTFSQGLIVVVLSLVSGLATYLILTGLTPIVPRNEVVLAVLFTNVVLIVAMIAVIAYQMAGLWRAWRQKVAGARLHVRIVALFSIIAALPAILLAVAATTTFSRSLDGWFSARTREIIANSAEVANAYLEEHGQVIRSDIVNMARDLNDAAAELQAGSSQFRNLVMVQAGLRGLNVAYVVDGAGNPLVAAIEDDRFPYRTLPEAVLNQAQAGQVPLLLPSSAHQHRVGAVTRLEGYPGTYLYVARSVSPEVLSYLQRTSDRVAEYEELRKRRGGLKFAHGLMYTMISLTALLAAIWIGLWFASRFVAPIRRLIVAAQEVSRGNLNIALPIRRGEGDMRRLSQTFNTMTSELKTQRDALVSANDQLMERRRFMEAVLAGVSAGVLGLDSKGSITLANRSAEKLLGVTAPELVGRPLDQVLPAFAVLLSQGEEQGLKVRQPDPVTHVVGGEERTFAIRITQEREGGEAQGSVVTFDDITELVSAQRSSAWADVARRIAHEIKNPLTPIILSAERIRRKYGRVITDDRDTFDKLTATIERQAGDIKSMVDEFASFARVPKPQMEQQDLRDAVQEPVILFRESHPQFTYGLDLPEGKVIAMFDRRLITQAITNLVKNATEAVETVAEQPDRPAEWTGHIETTLRALDDRVEIEVVDNGTGLAKQNRSRLLEPYVTTKAKGTGLGLAIVQKIVEQHAGVLTLEDAPVGEGRARGALVRITLPLPRYHTSEAPTPAAA